MDRYQKIEKPGQPNLGEGTYGVVYKVMIKIERIVISLFCHCMFDDFLQKLAISNSS